MRIRTIKPEFWASESVGRLDRDTRLVFVGLWSLADDQGRFRADPRFIAGQLFPYDSDGAQVVARGLAKLREESTIILYEVDRCHYGAIPSWAAHQKIDKPSKSRLPEPPPQQPRETSRGFGEDSASPLELSWEEGKGREGKGEEGKGEKPMSSELDEPVSAKPKKPVTPEALEDKLTDDEWQVFEHWRVTMGHPKARATPERRRLLAKWLPLYSVADLCRAINGCKATPWNMGENPGRVRYDGLELILRDAAHIERFMASAPGVRGAA